MFFNNNMIKFEISNKLICGQSLNIQKPNNMFLNNEQVKNKMKL